MSFAVGGARVRWRLRARRRRGQPPRGGEPSRDVVGFATRNYRRSVAGRGEVRQDGSGATGGNGSAPPGGGIAPEEARAKVVRRWLGRETRATRQSRNLPSTSSPTRRECETSRAGIETTRRDAAGVRERETTAAGARAVISDIVRIGARTRAPRFVQQARGEARPLHYRATRIGLVPVGVGNGIFVHAQHPELHK